MRNIIKTTTMAFIGGLCTAGLVLAAGTGAETGQPSQQVTDVQLDQKQVSEVQNALKEKGYTIGRVDGIVGPQTMDAIREFQSKEGLTATGQADPQTLKALGIEAGEQEFMGVSPEFGEEKQTKPLPQTPMDQMDKMPMDQTEQMPMDQTDKMPMEQQPEKSSGRNY